MRVIQYAAKSDKAMVCHITPRGCSAALCGKQAPVKMWGWIGELDPSESNAKRINGTVLSACLKCHARLGEVEEAVAAAVVALTEVKAPSNDTRLCREEGSHQRSSRHTEAECPVAEQEEKA